MFESLLPLHKIKSDFFSNIVFHGLSHCHISYALEISYVFLTFLFHQLQEILERILEKQDVVECLFLLQDIKSHCLIAYVSHFLKIRCNFTQFSMSTPRNFESFLKAWHDRMYIFTARNGIRFLLNIVFHDLSHCHTD